MKKYKKEEKDEFTMQVMSKCNEISHTWLLFSVLFIAFAGGIFGHIQVITTEIMGWMLMISLFVSNCLKCIIYYYYNKKGF